MGLELVCLREASCVLLEARLNPGSIILLRAAMLVRLLMVETYQYGFEFSIQ